mgnify:CR=1 FL=1|tara:strand:+ start:10058 stop:12568 length:2511 start_codon:yes stop_codon:yes gene_type:complete
MKYLTMCNKIAVLFTLFVGLIQAQEVTVIDALNSKPIPNVSLYNQSKNRNTTTDKNGRCFISIFNDNEKISFQFMGYETQSLFKKDLERINYVIALKTDLKKLSEVILSVARTASKKTQIAEKVSIINALEIKKKQPQTGADLLLLAPGVRLQKSQGGGGSPVLRGFEANRVLLVVDGIRMNNAIYRSGHLQNAITIDPNTIERVEVVYGSSSVGYGSDALGGVVHYFTKTPRINSNESFKSNFSSNFNSGNTSFVNHFDTELSFKNWGSYSSISFSSFGDIRMGKNRSHGFENWGLVPFYSENTDKAYRLNPTINNNPNIQNNSGYDQVDLLQKFIVKLSKEKLLSLNIQLSNSSNIPRFDKLNEYKNGELLYSEWYYGPQNRFLISPQLKLFPKKKFFYKGYLTLAYQNIKESRISRKFDQLDRRYQQEHLQVWSFNGDFETAKTGPTSFAYGFEWINNKVDSYAFSRKLLLDGNTVLQLSNPKLIPTRYPNAGGHYNSAALYNNFKWNINPKTTLTIGGRFTHTQLKAQWNTSKGIYPTWLLNSPNFNLSKIDVKNYALTGSLSITNRPSANLQLNFLVSSGFRSPNIDDLGKIRESKGTLIIPNLLLKPEYANNLDLGVSFRTPDKKGKFALRLYSTFITDYIGRKYSPNYKDPLTDKIITFNFNDDIVETQFNANIGNALIHGASFEGSWSFNSHFTFSSDMTYTNAEFLEGFGPLPSILPFYGSLIFEYKNQKLSIQIRNRFSSSKNPNDFSLGGEDGLEETPVQITSFEKEYLGSPSWSILNLSGSYDWSDKILFRTGIENIFDTHYREFASGISAPGRSLILGIGIEL